MASSLKQRQAGLENELATHRKIVERVEDEMKQLWRCDDETKELARSLVREAIDKMQVEEEMDHKFNLQVAENKRMQTHVTELKKENKYFQEQLSAMTERLKLMEQELIG